MAMIMPLEEKYLSSLQRRLEYLEKNARSDHHYAQEEKAALAFVIREYKRLASAAA